eukprot:PhM_4_TR10512/c3_g1_i1/m.53368
MGSGHSHINNKSDSNNAHHHDLGGRCVHVQPLHQQQQLRDHDSRGSNNHINNNNNNNEHIHVGQHDEGSAAAPSTSHMFSSTSSSSSFSSSNEELLIDTILRSIVTQALERKRKPNSTTSSSSSPLWRQALHLALNIIPTQFDYRVRPNTQTAALLQRLVAGVRPNHVSQVSPNTVSSPRVHTTNWLSALELFLSTATASSPSSREDGMVVLDLAYGASTSSPDASPLPLFTCAAHYSVTCGFMLPPTRLSQLVFKAMEFEEKGGEGDDDDDVHDKCLTLLQAIARSSHDAAYRVMVEKVLAVKRRREYTKTDRTDEANKNKKRFLFDVHLDVVEDLALRGGDWLLRELPVNRQDVTAEHRDRIYFSIIAPRNRVDGLYDKQNLSVTQVCNILTGNPQRPKSVEFAHIMRSRIRMIQLKDNNNNNNNNNSTAPTKNKQLYQILSFRSRTQLAMMGEDRGNNKNNNNKSNKSPSRSVAMSRTLSSVLGKPQHQQEQEQQNRDLDKALDVIGDYLTEKAKGAPMAVTGASDSLYAGPDGRGGVTRRRGKSRTAYPSEIESAARAQHKHGGVVGQGHPVTNHSSSHNSPPPESYYRSLSPCSFSGSWGEHGKSD